MIGALALIGYYSGALRQVLRLGCLVSAYAFSWIVAWPIDRLLCERFRFSPSVSYAFSRCVGGILVYIAASFVAELINRRIGSDKAGSVHPWNRKAGAALGALKGLLLVAIVLFLLDCFPDAVNARWPTLSAQMQSSVSGRIASAVNPVADLPVVDDVRAIRETASNPELAERVGRDPRVRRLLEHPKIVGILQDPDIAEALTKRRFTNVLRNPKVREIAHDADVRRIIRETDLFEAIRSATGELREFEIKETNP